MEKNNKIKISFGIIVLNGQPFVKYCLRQLYPFAHEIIVVEGGSKYNTEFITKDGHSMDGTLKALNEFKKEEDPENKLKIITKNGFWSEKTEQSQAFAQIATGDYLWQVDIDEFYKEKDIKKNIEILKEDPSITALSFKNIIFFGDIKYRVDSCYLQKGPDLFYRLFKWGRGYRYIEHRPPTVVNKKGEKLTNVNYLDGNRLFKEHGILLYHYGMLFPSQVKSKTKYHAVRDKVNRDRLYYNNFIKLKPFRFHNNYKFVSWLDEYKGEHPKQILNMMRDIKEGKINVDLRDNSDIEILLKKRSYRITKKYLIKIYGDLELFYYTKLLKTHIKLGKSLVKVAKYGYNTLRKRYKKLFDKKKILNVNKELNKNKKKALLIYLTHPFKINTEYKSFVSHTNYWRNIEIAKIIGEFGYIVDVMDFNDFKSKVKPDYDLLIGFGRADDLAQCFPQQTIKLFLGTGSEPNFQNQREKERVEELNRRRSCNLEPVRLTPYVDSENFRYYDALLCLGNATTADTYRPFFDKEIYLWNNHSYDHWMRLPESKNFEESRRNFMYFAGSGQVLNGLDLLLEVFVSKPNLNLYVCGPFEKESSFVACFRRELYETPNIFPIGWVGVGSSEYFDVIRKCGMVIVPICAGAGHGAVTVCMGNGLIPIVTKEAGIDTDGFGITLPSYKIENIAAAVDWISSQPAEWHEETAHKVLDATRRDFSQAAFSRRFQEILREVTAR